MKVSTQSGCAGCPLAARCPDADFVPPKLAVGDRLAIGMNPGRHEVEHRPPEPFVGPSGRLLAFGYGKVDVAMGTVSKANCVQCRMPLPQNLFPLEPKARPFIPHGEAKVAVEHCWRAYVLPLLASRQWRRIDLLGADALRLGTGKSGLDTWGGYQLEMLDAPQLGAVAVGTYHPAFLMRQAEMLPLWINDLRRSLTPAPEAHILQGGPADFPTPLRSLDLETSAAGFPIENIEVRLLAVSGTPYNGVCYRWTPLVQTQLQQALDGCTELHGHNLTAFDMPILEAAGVRFPWNYADPAKPEMDVWDTMLIHHILWPTFTGMHDLGVLGRRYTSQRAWKQWHASDDPEELYAARDASFTLAIGEKLRAELVREPKLLHLYKYCQLPLARMCHYMSQTGLLRDPPRLKVVRERTEAKMVRLEADLPLELRTRREARNRRVAAPEGVVTKAGKPRKFVLEPYEEAASPWASSKQLGAWLYETQGYPEQYSEEGNRTTGKEALDRLIHRVADPTPLKAVRELRSLQNLLSGPVPAELPEGTERLHPSYLPHGTATGRLSSSGPNIQNWNEKDADGDLTARYLIVPSCPGWAIWSADFSQIEARLTAWFSKDAERLAHFAIPGFSEHKWVAALFFDLPYRFDTTGVQVDGVVKDNDKDAPYGIAKRINLGSNYCLGATSIARKFDWDLSATKRRYERWREFMPRCVAWQQATMEEAKARKVLYNPFSRRGLFYMPNSGPKAVAFRPQSTAADIIYRAMLSLLFERIQWPRWKVEKVVHVIRPLPQPATICAQVHDQLLGECPREALADVLGGVKEAMSQPWPELDNFHIPVTLESGESWGELEAYKGV